MVASLPTPHSELDSVLRALPTIAARIPTTAPQSLRHLPFVRDHQDTFKALTLNLATVRDISFPSKTLPSSPLIIHIQDIHHNHQAQSRIADLIRSLTRDGERPVNLIALEGTWGTIDPMPFRRFPDRATLTRTMDHLLSQNEISGPIYAACTGTGEFPPIIGVDDRFHHTANADAYRQAAVEIPGLQTALRNQKTLSDKAKRAVFSPILSRFDEAIEAYHTGSASLAQYVSALATHSSDIPSAVADFKCALDLEKSLDFDRVERERTEILSTLLGRLNKENRDNLLTDAIAYRAGRLGYADFYKGLESLCSASSVSLDGFPEFRRYIRYALKTDGINAETLFRQLNQMERQVYNALAQTPTALALVEEVRALRLMSKLVDFSLTPEEWSEYTTTKNVGEHRFESLKPFEGFYEEASIRDGLMAENLLRALGSPAHDAKFTRAPLVILVTGGYHAAGLKEQLNRAGAVVISVVPKIEKIDSPSGAQYLSVFSREKTPLDKLFQGEKLFLATPPSAGLSSAPFWMGLLARSGKIAKDLYDALRYPLRLKEVTLEERNLVARFENDQAVQFEINGSQWQAEPRRSSWFEANFWIPYRELGLSLPAHISTPSMIRYIEKHLAQLDVRQKPKEIKRILEDWLSGTQVWLRAGTLTGLLSTALFICWVGVNPWFWLPLFAVSAIPAVSLFHYGAHVLYNIFHPLSRLAIGITPFTEVAQFIHWAAEKRTENPDMAFSVLLQEAENKGLIPSGKKEGWAPDASYAEKAWEYRDAILSQAREELLPTGQDVHTLSLEQADVLIRSVVQRMPILSSQKGNKDLGASSKKPIGRWAAIFLAKALVSGENVSPVTSSRVLEPSLHEGRTMKGEEAVVSAVPSAPNGDVILPPQALSPVRATDELLPLSPQDENNSTHSHVGGPSNGTFSSLPLGLTLTNWREMIDWQIREKNLIAYWVNHSNPDSLEATLTIRPRRYPLKIGSQLRFTGPHDADRFVTVKAHVEVGQSALTVMARDPQTIRDLGVKGDFDAASDPVLPVLRSVLEVILRPQGLSEPFKRLFGLDGLRETAWGVPVPIIDHPIDESAIQKEVDEVLKSKTVLLTESDKTNATAVLSTVIHRWVVEQGKAVLLVGDRNMEDLEDLLDTAARQSVPFVRVGKPPENLTADEERRWVSARRRTGSSDLHQSDVSSTGILVAAGILNIKLDKEFNLLATENGKSRIEIFDAIVYVGAHQYPAVYSFVPLLYAKEGAQLIFSGKNNSRPLKAFGDISGLVEAGFNRVDIQTYNTNALAWIRGHSAVVGYQLALRYPDVFGSPSDPADQFWDGTRNVVVQNWLTINKYLAAPLAHLDEQLVVLKSLGLSTSTEPWIEGLTNFMKIFREGFELNQTVVAAVDEWAKNLAPDEDLNQRYSVLQEHLDSLADKGYALLDFLSSKISSMEDLGFALAFLGNVVQPILTEKMFIDLVKSLPSRISEEDTALSSLQDDLNYLGQRTRDIDYLSPTEWLHLLSDLDAILNGEGGLDSLFNAISAKINNSKQEEELDRVFKLMGGAENLAADAWSAAEVRIGRELQLISLDQVASDSASSEEAYERLFHRLFTDTSLSYLQAPPKIKDYLVNALARHLYLIGKTSREGGATPPTTALSSDFTILMNAYNEDLTIMKLKPGEFYTPGEVHQQLIKEFKSDTARNGEVKHAYGRLNGSHYASVRQHLRSSSSINSLAFRTIRLTASLLGNRWKKGGSFIMAIPLERTAKGFGLAGLLWEIPNLLHAAGAPLPTFFDQAFFRILPVMDPLGLTLFLIAFWTLHQLLLVLELAQGIRAREGPVNISTVWGEWRQAVPLRVALLSFLAFLPYAALPALTVLGIIMSLAIIFPVLTHLIWDLSQIASPSRRQKNIDQESSDLALLRTLLSGQPLKLDISTVDGSPALKRLDALTGTHVFLLRPADFIGFLRVKILGKFSVSRARRAVQNLIAERELAHSTDSLFDKGITIGEGLVVVVSNEMGQRLDGVVESMVNLAKGKPILWITENADLQVRLQDIMNGAIEARISNGLITRAEGSVVVSGRALEESIDAQSRVDWNGGEYSVALPYHSQIDMEGVGESSLLRKAIFIFLDETLRGIALKFESLQTIDRIARRLASDA